MSRDNLDGQPKISQIDYSRTRNIFALMSYNYNLITSLEGERVLGKYRITVKAKRDIRDREELTFNASKHVI